MWSCARLWCLYPGLSCRHVTGHCSLFGLEEQCAGSWVSAGSTGLNSSFSVRLSVLMLKSQPVQGQGPLEISALTESQLSLRLSLWLIFVLVHRASLPCLPFSVALHSPPQDQAIPFTYLESYLQHLPSGLAKIRALGF